MNEYESEIGERTTKGRRRTAAVRLGNSYVSVFLIRMCVTSALLVAALGCWLQDAEALTITNVNDVYVTLDSFDPAEDTWADLDALLPSLGLVYRYTGVTVTSLDAALVAVLDTNSILDVAFAFQDAASGSARDFRSAVFQPSSGINLFTISAAQLSDLTSASGQKVLVEVVPEPTTALLLGFGLFGLGMKRRRGPRGAVFH